MSLHSHDNSHSNSAIKYVTLLGADGRLGPAVLHGLLNARLKVTVLKRATSTSPSNYPVNVDVVKCPDEFAVDDLVRVLRGQDAIVITIMGSQVELQKRIADAAAKAGIKRLIPADFGSCDSSSQHAQELVPLFKKKTELRDHLMHLAKENESFTWTSLVCGHFFDMSLDFLHMYLKERKADVLDDGEVKCSMSTLARVGEATAAILSRPRETANQVLYMQSFCATQNAVIKAFEKATGAEWTLTRYNSAEYEKSQKAKADRGDLEAVEDLVWMLGTAEANWEGREGFAMKLLDLKEEDLDTVVKDTVTKMETEA